MWGRRWLTVVCMREPNLPPSAVRVEDVSASKAPGPPFPPPTPLSVCPSLSSLAMSCCQPTYACLQWRGVGYGRMIWGSGGGDMGSLRLFSVAVDTCLLACAPPVCSLLTPPASPFLFPFCFPLPFSVY